MFEKSREKKDMTTCTNIVFVVSRFYPYIIDTPHFNSFFNRCLLFLTIYFTDYYSLYFRIKNISSFHDSNEIYHSLSLPTDPNKQNLEAITIFFAFKRRKIIYAIRYDCRIQNF